MCINVLGTVLGNGAARPTGSGLDYSKGSGGRSTYLVQLLHHYLPMVSPQPSKVPKRVKGKVKVRNSLRFSVWFHGPAGLCVSD